MWSEEEAQTTLAQSHKGDVDGILAPLSLALNLPGEILKAAAQRAIPTMFSIHGRFLVEHGGLASYGADAYASGRQAARLVEKISKGTAPAAIPVEVNSTDRTRHQPEGRCGARLHDRATGVVSGGSPDPLILAECQDEKQVHASRQEETRRSQ